MRRRHRSSRLISKTGRDAPLAASGMHCNLGPSVRIWRLNGQNHCLLGVPGCPPSTGSGIARTERNQGLKAALQHLLRKCCALIAQTTRNMHQTGVLPGRVAKSGGGVDPGQHGCASLLRQTRPALQQLGLRMIRFQTFGKNFDAQRIFRDVGRQDAQMTATDGHTWGSFVAQGSADRAGCQTVTRTRRRTSLTAQENRDTAPMRGARATPMLRMDANVIGGSLTPLPRATST